MMVDMGDEVVGEVSDDGSVDVHVDAPTLACSRDLPGCMEC